MFTLLSAVSAASFTLGAFDISALLTWDSLVALLTLTALEIVLGIDNIVFIAILAGKLPEQRRAAAWRVGLALAMVMRVLLLLAIGLIMSLDNDLFVIAGMGFSGRDLILIGGGLFLIAKATFEMHDKLEAAHESATARKAVAAGFAAVVTQIILLDIVFSIDSVITAVGMARAVEVMVLAVILAVLVMMVFAGPISAFIHRHPTMKMLALSFLLMIGVVLLVDGFGVHIQKGYIYFAMGFSLFVEMLNLRLRRNQPVPLYPGPAAPPSQTH